MNYPIIKTISGRRYRNKPNVHDPNYDKPISELNKTYPLKHGVLIFKVR